MSIDITSQWFHAREIHFLAKYSIIFHMVVTITFYWVQQINPGTFSSLNLSRWIKNIFILILYTFLNYDVNVS